MSNSPVVQRDRLTKERRQRVARERLNFPDPTLCSECGVVYSSGRWAWREAPEKTHKAICPACQRIRQHAPAGYIELSGPFFNENRDEIMNLVANVEALQKTNYPLERMLAIEDLSDHTLVTTTGVHVARRIGEALARAYQGEFSFTYGDGEKLIRVYWSR